MALNADIMKKDHLWMGTNYGCHLILLFSKSIV